MSVSNSGGVRAVNASSASPTIVLPSDVVAGDAIVLCVRTPTNETVVISSITDPVNGTWNLGTTLRQGPNDQSGSTQRAWYFVLTNSAALTGAGNRTITVNFDATISSQIVAAWFRSTLGALTFGAMATLLNQGTNATNYDSNAAAASGAGVAVGFLATISTQATVPTCDGAGETNLNAADGASRSFLFNEDVASAGNYGFELTLVTTTIGMLAVGTLIEPAVVTVDVTDVDTDESITGTQTFTITGTGFEASQGAGHVRAYDPGGTLYQSLSINSWSDTSISATMSVGATPTGVRYGVGAIRVTNNSASQDSLATTFTVPTGKNYVNLTSVEAEAANRITAVGDLAINDQIEWSNVVGGTVADVTINADATFVVGAAVTSFDVRVHNVVDGWGSLATQTIGETPEITISSLPDATAGEAYSTTVTASGTAPITFSLSGPSWLAINSSTGEITGIPGSENVGSSSAAITATGPGGVDVEYFDITVLAVGVLEYPLSFDLWRRMPEGSRRSPKRVWD